MSTVSVSTDSASKPVDSSPVYDSQLEIGKTLNAEGNYAVNTLMQTVVNDAAINTLLGQAMSKSTGGSVEGSLLGLDTMLSAGIGSLGSMDKLAMSAASKGISSFSKANILIKPGDSSSSSVSESSSSEENVSNYVNTTFTKMNVPNTSDEEDYRGKAVGFSEKRDSPVRLIIGSETIDKFFLTSVSYEMKEKIQMMSMLDSSDIIYLFGDNPTMVTFAGICLDTYNFQWLRDMTTIYRKKARGTVSVSSATPISVCYDDERVEGVIINMTTGKSASSLNSAEIRFTMIITDTMSTAINTDPGKTTTIKTVDITKEAEVNIADRTASANSKKFSYSNKAISTAKGVDERTRDAERVGNYSSIPLINKASAK